MITGDEIRTLLGAEIGPDAKATSVSGRVIREMRDSGATVFEFDDVQLTGTSTGGPKVVGATGSLMAQTTTTGDTLDATLTNNRIAVSLDGLPAGIDFTLFATKNLERTLTGPATFSCDGSTLRTIDADSTIRLTWSRARAR